MSNDIPSLNQEQIDQIFKEFSNQNNTSLNFDPYNCLWDNDDAGKDETPNTVKLGFNWFDWSSIKPTDTYKYNTVSCSIYYQETEISSYVVGGVKQDATEGAFQGFSL